MRQFGFAGSVAAIAAVTVVAAPAAQAQEISYRLPEAIIVDEVRTTYDGEVVLADDLDLF